MINIASQFGQVSYNVVKLVLDTADDVVYLPQGFAPGSTAFVIENSDRYMLNSKGEWKKVKTASTSSGDDSTDGDVTVPDTDGDGVPDYDGGTVS